MPARSLRTIIVFLAIWVAVSGAPRAQIPTTFQNLQHYPKDISREELIQQMRQFSFALGVRCQYCHTGGDGISFDGVEFKSDEKIPKVKARQMLRMVNEINTKVLAGISPRRSAHTVTGERADRLALAIKDVLRRSIADGGSSLRDHMQPDGELGYFQTRFVVYDREGQPCADCACGKGVRRIVQSGRSTFFCPVRQR